MNKLGSESKLIMFLIDKRLCCREEIRFKEKKR